MNKYTATAMMQDAHLNARRIIILVRDGYLIPETLREFADVEQSWQFGAKVYRANGQQRVEFPHGGRIDIMPVRGHGLRGRSADVVFIDNDAHRALSPDIDGTDSRRFRDDVAAVLATGGKVIYS